MNLIIVWQQRAATRLRFWFPKIVYRWNNRWHKIMVNRQQTQTLYDNKVQAHSADLALCCFYDVSTLEEEGEVVTATILVTIYAIQWCNDKANSRLTCLILSSGDIHNLPRAVTPMQLLRQKPIATVLMQTHWNRCIILQSAVYVLPSFPLSAKH